MHSYLSPPSQKPRISRAASALASASSLRGDCVFAWRQLTKSKITSAAAILSLALTIGACTSAFRLIDAVFLRPLPIRNPSQLYFLSREGIAPNGKWTSFDHWTYPAYLRMRAAAKDHADLIAVNGIEQSDLMFNSNQETERAGVTWVSGSMFDSFGLRPALGRLLTVDDDRVQGMHFSAVLSYDYWNRRFGKDPNIIGRTFQLKNRIYLIIGVADGGFTGTMPGSVTDIFLPTMSRDAHSLADTQASWVGIFAQVKPGVAPEPLRAQLDATARAVETERVKEIAGLSKDQIDRGLNQKLLMTPAATGVSGMQKQYQRPLTVLAIVAGLVLLIASTNVATLRAAHAVARLPEMALRISLGASRWRLVQLVAVESSILAFLATGIGGLFALWSAPLVVRMIRPSANPAGLPLSADWRVLIFAFALALGLTIFFGLAPALRASAVKPAVVLKGGDDPRSRRRFTRALIVMQVAFCFVVLFLAGLFVDTFERLSNRSTGFSAERVLTLETIAQPSALPVSWEQLADRLRSVPGVEAAAVAGWPLLSERESSRLIWINGPAAKPILMSDLQVSPGWLSVMKIPLIAGRDFRADDKDPGAAIVNEAFVREFLNGENPIGRSFDDMNASSDKFFVARSTQNDRDRIQIVGLVGDALYDDLRKPAIPVVYVPFRSYSKQYETLVVRTSSPNPAAMASILRDAVAREGRGFQVTKIRTQLEINQLFTTRERLLATLSLFFSGVALLLAGVGLYGVLHYSAVQRRREIGIRMALGAQAGDVSRLMIADSLLMILIGVCAGIGLGTLSARYVESLLYGVRINSATMFAVPMLFIVAIASLAALPPVLYAVRIDPAEALRSE